MAVSNASKTQVGRKKKGKVQKQSKNPKEQETFKEHNTPIWQVGRAAQEVFILGGIMSGLRTGGAENWQEKNEDHKNETGNDSKYNNNLKSKRI